MRSTKVMWKAIQKDARGSIYWASFNLLQAAEALGDENYHEGLASVKEAIFWGRKAWEWLEKLEKCKGEQQVKKYKKALKNYPTSPPNGTKLDYGNDT